MSEGERYEIIEPYELYYLYQGKAVKSTYLHYLAASIFFLGFGGFMTWVLDNWINVVGTVGDVPFCFPIFMVISIGSLAIGTVLFVQLIWIVLLDLFDTFENDMILRKSALVVSRPQPQVEMLPEKVVGSSPPPVVTPRFRVLPLDNIISYRINPMAYALLKKQAEDRERRRKNRKSSGKKGEPSDD